MALINLHKILHITKLTLRAFRQYRKRFLVILILGILSGLTGGIGIGAIIPLFSLAVGENSLIGGEDAITGMLKRFFDVFNLPFTLPFLVSFIAALFVAKGFIQFLTKYINDRTAAEYEKQMRVDLIDKVMHASWPYLINQKLGYIERIIMNDVLLSSRVIVHGSTLILFLTSFLIYAVVAFNISAVITLITLGLGIALLFVFKPLFYKTRQVARELADNEKLVTHHISESILGSKVIKTSSHEDKVIKKSQDFFDQLEQARVKTAIYIYSVGSVFEPLGFIFVAIVFAFYFKDPGFNIISFAAVVYLIQKMFAFIQAAQGSIHRINEMVPFLQTVLEFRSLAQENREEFSGVSRFDFQDSIRFKDVKFSYDAGKSEVLSGVTFEIKKGQMIGLVGVSGAGKTTIADLLLRLFYPNSGEILIDNRGVSEFNIKSWRKKIGYVSQEVFLLNDTIKNNIKFEDPTITEADIIQAAKAASIYNFIQKLPNKFDTNIGERGLKLSGGQRQRIALARTLARQPEIIILDEATSSLDTKSELAIQKAIETLKGKTTVLAIAHRLSTVMNSDHLVVLEKGKIIEEGPPTTLLRTKDSHFYKMYNIK